jgi:hypothetical protein
MILATPISYKNQRVYCASAITALDSGVAKFTAILEIIDLAISFLDFLIYLFNKSRIKKYKK